jgi:hypothetical protein
MNFSLSIWLKQHRMAVGGMILAIAITVYNTSGKSQPPSANTSSVTSLIASSPKSLKRGFKPSLERV